MAHLAKRFPATPVIPVFMYGLGRSLPKGEWALVPVICDLLVGTPLYGSERRQEFMAELEAQMQSLGSQIHHVAWE